METQGFHFGFEASTFDGPLARSTFFFWNLGAWGILQQRLEISMLVKEDELMEKEERLMVAWREGWLLRKAPGWW